MTLIFLGLALWYSLHFMPAAKPHFRSALIKNMGANAYAGSFSLGLIGAIILMVMGWRGSDPWILYNLPEWSFIPGKLLVLFGVMLFGFGFERNMKTNLKRFFRHLQLTGMLFWATGHLILNGDNRSVVLFGGLALWAVFMMTLVNRRDGVWVKPEKASPRQEFVPAVIALLFVVGFVFGHAHLSGVALL